MKKNAFLFILLLCSPLLLASPRFFAREYRNLGDPFLELSLCPGAVIPFLGDSELFSVGANAMLTGELKLAGLPYTYAFAESGYNYIPVRAESTLSVIPIGVGGLFKINMLPRLEARASLSGGYYFAALHSSPFLEQGKALWDSNPYFSLRVGPSFFFSTAFSLGLEASYVNYLGLVQFLGVSLAGSYHIPIAGRSPLQIREVEVDNLFPVLYRCYDTDPPGRALIKNTGRFPVNEVQASFFINPYMTHPTTWRIGETILPGEEIEIDLRMLFNDRILAIVEGSKFSGEFCLAYDCFGRHHETRTVLPVEIHDRNSLTWEDDRKAALFITEKDPYVLEFSSSTVSAIKRTRLQPINPNFRVAAGIHSALCVFGMTYVMDPKSPYSERIKDGMSIDFLKFPRQTLLYSAGDCDDLTILYCALLESISIESAFITVPGHIFAAVSLGISQEQASKMFNSIDDLIFLGGKTWLPIEVTELDGGFVLAWQLGARQWREHLESGKAKLYPVHAAWEEYPPLGLPAGDLGIEPPPENALLQLYSEELYAFIQRELEPKVEQCQQRIAASGGHPKEINTLGVLYARYGLYDEARLAFQRVLDKEEYMPALLNLGNICFIEEDYESAMLYFERAHHLNPTSANVLLCLARTHYQLELYEKTKKYYARLKEVKPELAGRFAYLVVRTKEELRAQEFVSFGREMLWEEE